MVQKALSLNKLFYVFVAFICVSCNKTENKKIVFEKINVSQIPNDTISITNLNLKLRNGIYYFGSNHFSGFIKEIYPTNSLKSLGSFFQGKQHGATKTYFENGKLESERNYNNGIGYGRHFGFWENGNMKFEFIYFNDLKEGLQKQWYKSGNPYYELTFRNDREEGMQKAWRENGKAYINYEVKDGVRYGLQKAVLCYTLKNQQLK
jgi:antitoxin component YwqK of YwqJK toxin-antitoxin module